MSAYIVSYKHIDAILTAYATTTWTNAKTEEDLTKLGRLLLAENVRSVAHRYGELPETSRATEYVFKRQYKTLKPVALIKLCEGLEYQSCETEDYYQTDAWVKLKWIYSSFISLLPGYEEAAWSI